MTDSKAGKSDLALLWTKEKDYFYYTEHARKNFGMSAKNADKLSSYIKEQFISEGFKVEIDYFTSEYRCALTHSIYVGERITFILNISW